MADTCVRKLVVEVCSARNLMPKDGQGTASAYAIVDYDGQRQRTKTKVRDLNPQWDEKLEFMVHNPETMVSDMLEVNVYNDKKTLKKSTFLGKVKVSGSSFAKSGSEALVYYPLEKRSVFSQVKGEIGLKIYYSEKASPADDAAPTTTETRSESIPAKEEDKKTEEKEKPEEDKGEETKTAPPAEDKKAEEDAKTPEKKETKAEEEKKPASGGGKKSKAEKKQQQKPSPAPTVVTTPVKEAMHSGFSDLEVRPMSSERAASTSYDLVERVPYMFVRVLRAKKGGDSGAEQVMYAKLVIGSHDVRTRAMKGGADWDQVFAFHKASLNCTALEISVLEEKKDGETTKEESLGMVSFDVQEVPKRTSQDSPLAPQWYTLEGGSSAAEDSPGTDVMLAIWIGTQADEAFQEAWQSDSGGLIVHTRSKAYLSPKLWYLRLTVIQTQDLRLPSVPDTKSKTPTPELIVKAQLGGQLFKTSRVPLISTSSSPNPSWNEDLVFVAAEPFDPVLTITLEDAAACKMVGVTRVPVSSIHRRVDDRAEPPSRWLNLCGDETRPYAGRVHVRVCLEGGYHVLEEAAQVASDVRAASKQLSKPPIGLLEVGVRRAANLVPMKVAKDGSSGSTDAYVVLKYGPKWARTRTIIDQFNPCWNEQYAWDVFDPCTVLTIGVFDNERYKPPVDADKAAGAATKDVRIGKVRVRLSTLDTNRAYVNTYPLTVVTPAGAKKMGEIELAIRFSCSSWLSMIQSYGSPMLPRMHYVRPLSPAQQDMLRQTAMRIVSGRLSRSEPPLGPEVVQYMLDTDAHTWSLRRSKANWFRVISCLAGVAKLVKWAHAVRTWAHPTTTVLVHLLLATVLFCPHMILPSACLYLVFILMWRFRARPREPVGMDPKLSQVDTVGLDELDEEFDGIPTSRPAEVLRMRYDRLRTLAGRAQVLLGDMAAQGERIEALLSWRDPRATGLFAGVCLLGSLVLYAVPFRMLLLLAGFYYLRHPRFRDDMPSAVLNFFRRLPSLADGMI